MRAGGMNKLFRIPRSLASAVAGYLVRLAEATTEALFGLLVPPGGRPDRRTAIRRSVFRILAVALWAATTARLIGTYAGPSVHVHYLSVWAVSAAGYLLGVLFWSLAWLRLPADQIFGAVVVGITLPLLYLSFLGQVRSDEVLSIYVAAAVFTAALLPMRTAMAAALLGALAAAVPLLAGWTTYYDGSLLVLVSVIGLLTYLQARMMGSLGQERRQAQERQRQMEESYMATIAALAASIFAKDRAVEAHSRGTATLVVAVGHRLGLRGDTLRLLEYAALLHDVGKIGIPGYLLNKPGPLSVDELARIRDHPVIAERILSAVPALAPVCPIIRAQYERWNGSGYPDGLAGEAIPLGARILHACVALHAMVSDRSYRTAISVEDAVTQLRGQAGRQFDPQVVEALAEVIEAREVEMVSDPAGGRPGRAAAHRDWMQQLETIEGVGSRLVSETGEEAACRLVGEAVVNLMPTDQCRILLLQPGTTRLVPRYVSALGRPEYAVATAENLSIEVGQGITGWVAETRRGLVVGDAERHPRAAHILGTPYVRESLVAAPAVFKGQVLGVVVAVRLGIDQYGRDHLRLLRILANQLAACIANARLVERVQASAAEEQPAA